MEQITFEETAKELVNQLESILGKLAVAADCGLSTNTLENEATKLATKIKTSAQTFQGLSCLYKDVEGSHVWNASELPDHLFMKFATFSKKCKDPNMSLKKDDEHYYAEISDNLFVCLNDLPSIPMPKFKVKIEGDTLMAITDNLYNQLPEKMQKLLKAGGEA